MQERMASALAVSVTVVREDIVPNHDKKGIHYLGLRDFLLDYRAING